MGTGDHQREQFETEDGLNLNRWHRKYKDRFMLADVLESLAIDKIQTGGGDKAGTVTIECPFEHEHSSTGGTATMAMNPGETEVGYWTVFCHHDACQDRDKLEFVKAMVDDGWFPESALTDDGWCVPLADEDLPSPVSSTAITPLSAPLWEDGLVTDGYCKRKKVPLIREQIRRNLRKRLSYVIVEGGKGKLFIHPKRGRLPEIWDDAALDKYYRNGGVVYDIKGANKQGIINPAKEFFLDDIRLTYSGTQFEPDLSKAGKTKYNTFNGFPVSPVRGDWSLLRGHIKDNLCGGNGEDQKEDEDLFNYVMTWCADMFQNPSHKLGSSIAIIGEEGVGKSKFFDWLREGLGDYAIKVASKKHLVGNFNSHLDSKLLVVAEEAFWSGDKEAASILKDFITSDTAMTERKGFDAVERASYTRVGFVTNSDWAVPTGDNADARRFLVLRASNAQKQNGAYFNAIDEQMHNGGLEAMVHELMHWNPADVGLSFDDLRKAPWTAARAEQASYGTSPAMAFLLQTIEDGVFTNRDGMDVELSDTKTTRVNRTELLFAVQGKATHGGARKAAKKVIEQILGDDVWHDNKHLFDDGERKRYVEFPPLDGLRASLKTTYR